MNGNMIGPTSHIVPSEFDFTNLWSGLQTGPTLDHTPQKRKGSLGRSGSYKKRRPPSRGSRRSTGSVISEDSEFTNGSICGSEEFQRTESSTRYSLPDSGSCLFRLPLLDVPEIDYPTLQDFHMDSFPDFDSRPSRASVFNVRRTIQHRRSQRQTKVVEQRTSSEPRSNKEVVSMEKTQIINSKSMTSLKIEKQEGDNQMSKSASSPTLEKERDELKSYLFGTSIANQVNMDYQEKRRLLQSSTCSIKQIETKPQVSLVNITSNEPDNNIESQEKGGNASQVVSICNKETYENGLKGTKTVITIGSPSSSDKFFNQRIAPLADVSSNVSRVPVVATVSQSINEVSENTKGLMKTKRGLLSAQIIDESNSDALDGKSSHSKSDKLTDSELVRCVDTGDVGDTKVFIGKQSRQQDSATSVTYRSSDEKRDTITRIYKKQSLHGHIIAGSVVKKELANDFTDIKVNESVPTSTPVLRRKTIGGIEMSGEADSVPLKNSTTTLTIETKKPMIVKPGRGLQSSLLDEWMNKAKKAKNFDWASFEQHQIKKQYNTFQSCPVLPITSHVKDNHTYFKRDEKRSEKTKKESKIDQPRINKDNESRLEESCETRSLVAHETSHTQNTPQDTKVSFTKDQVLTGAKSTGQLMYSVRTQSVVQSSSKTFNCCTVLSQSSSIPKLNEIAKDCSSYQPPISPSPSKAATLRPDNDAQKKSEFPEIRNTSQTNKPNKVTGARKENDVNNGKKSSTNKAVPNSFREFDFQKPSFIQMTEPEGSSPKNSNSTPPRTTIKHISGIKVILNNSPTSKVDKSIPTIPSWVKDAEQKKNNFINWETLESDTKNQLGRSCTWIKSVQLNNTENQNKKTTEASNPIFIHIPPPGAQKFTASTCLAVSSPNLPVSFSNSSTPGKKPLGSYVDLTSPKWINGINETLKSRNISKTVTDQYVKATSKSSNDLRRDKDPSTFVSPQMTNGLRARLENTPWESLITEKREKLKISRSGESTSGVSSGTTSDEEKEKMKKPLLKHSVIETPSYHGKRSRLPLPVTRHQNLDKSSSTDSLPGVSISYKSPPSISVTSRALDVCPSPRKSLILKSQGNRATKESSHEKVDLKRRQILLSKSFPSINNDLSTYQKNSYQSNNHTFVVNKMNEDTTRLNSKLLSAKGNNKGIRHPPQTSYRKSPSFSKSDILKTFDNSPGNIDSSTMVIKKGIPIDPTVKPFYTNFYTKDQKNTLNSDAPVVRPPRRPKPPERRKTSEMRIKLKS